MSDSNQRPRRSKAAKNTFTTKSGKTIKVNRSLSARVKAGREAKAQRKAAYLSTLPKERWKRILYRLSPKRMYKYWFSRDGAIMALKVAGIGFAVIFLLIVGLFAYFRKDLPKIQSINSGNSGGSIAYYDRTGTVLLFQDYDAFKRIPVTNQNIASYMQEATVAVEDKDFYHEGAFNVKGITRAAINNATGGSTQGGSTITQQLVKLNEGWTNDHTVSRKVKELILAVELEREYSKQDILTAYLNLAPYSGLDYGVQAASQDYFHVDASQLTLAQAALLAAMPKSPGSYSPYASPVYNPSATDNLFDENGLIARQQYILDQMASQGYITKAQAAAAKQVDIMAQVQQMPTSHYAGMKPGFEYAVLSAKEELAKDFPASVIKSGGWKVTTTIDVNLQNLANTSLDNNASS
ncbi:MAG: transglycosylase domain-containing protein [Candidatus Saccharibacteria bacterium]